jgi:myo-inositol-1(or 4)-monophosphatase
LNWRKSSKQDDVVTAKAVGKAIAGKPTLEIVESLARQAGDILRSGYGKRHEVRFKSPIDLVTEIDHKSEKFLISEIYSQFPDHQIIGEETGIHEGDACCRWYLDPLDGTVNYAHGVPIFAVSIGYMEEGVMRLGAVYDPLRDEAFTAELGKGAWLNGGPIHASNIHLLSQALLVTGFPYDIQVTPQDNLGNYARFSKTAQAVRRLGSAALELCYVGCGRFEGYWEISLHAWDLAAGMLIATEAGARVTDLSGEDTAFQPPYSVIAAPPEIHRQMLEVMEHQLRRE